MDNDINITVEGLWKAGIKGTDIEDLPEHIQEQFRVFFYSGAHALLITHDSAQKYCRSKEEYIGFLARLSNECIDARIAGSEVSLIDVDQIDKEKKPVMKLVVNNTCISPD